ncbi:MAG: phosphatidylinositol-4- kinase [Cirrosporium novae-zelandiae]|nr:MAG: phosphatidylinositol-4- kinase [Cirrosporium novae-zelandiae]
MDCQSLDIRSKAFQKIALLSAGPSTSESQISDLDRLRKACLKRPLATNGLLDGVFKGISPTSRVPMSLRELQVLLSLCQAAPLLQDIDSASKLSSQLSSYLPEAHTQLITTSPFLHQIEPSPWEALSYQLTSALLCVGLKYKGLRDEIQESVTIYLENCSYAVKAIPSVYEQPEDYAENGQEAAEVVTIAVSILGFLEAAAKQADFWTASERLQLIGKIRDILKESFLTSVEAALSTIRNSRGLEHRVRDWKRYIKHCAASGRPLGAVLIQGGFMKFVQGCTSLLVAPPEALEKEDILDVLIRTHGRIGVVSEDVDTDMREILTDIATEEMQLLQDGSDYLQLGSAWQQRLAFTVKSHTFRIFLNCMIIDEEVADPDKLLGWLEETLADPLQMGDEVLALTVLKCLTVIALWSPPIAPNIGKSLLRFIVQAGSSAQIIGPTSTCLAYVLQVLSQDSVITTLYSLGNVLSSSTAKDKPLHASPNLDATNGTPKHDSPYLQQMTGSAISLELSGEEETSIVYGNVVQAIVTIASNSKDEKIIALAQSMLLQKIGKVATTVDARIVTEAAVLAISGAPLEFRTLIKFFLRVSQDAARQGNRVIIDAVSKARLYLSKTLSLDSELYAIYRIHLLESIIATGDIAETGSPEGDEVELAAKEIAQLLHPLAILTARGSDNDIAESDDDSDFNSLYRDAWYNIVVHGISLDSALGQRYRRELRILAYHSTPLIDEDWANHLESDVELNTILRRGMTPQHAMNHKKSLISLMPMRESEIRGLSYPKVIFLRAAYLVETLRAESGQCTKVLTYFLEPSLKNSEMGSCMMTIADSTMGLYLSKVISGQNLGFSAPYVAKQLSQIFALCCHRIEKVQQVAATSADRILRAVPSALCQRSSLFALLELLSIMWKSCLEADIEEYSWSSTFTSARAKISIELSDDYDFRRSTLDSFHKKARSWVMSVIDIAPLDIKGLLQTYLSEYDDDGAYGHVSLGRSFALEMGSTIPTTDQRLGAIDRHGSTAINVASDFVAQYTTRQEYRYADTLPNQDQDWLDLMHIRESRRYSVVRPAEEFDTARTVLEHLRDRTTSHKFVSIGELRDILRRAAALLCRSKQDQCAIIQHLVGIPFSIFTKQSIQLGISLWQGIIHENPRMESRILAEIVQNWESTIRRKIGIFSTKFRILDPFYEKEEFAPSDREALIRRQQAAHNLITPHFRILQFLSSHFSATRLCSRYTQKMFVGLIRITLEGLGHTAGHPLAREFHFYTILLGLSALRYSTDLRKANLWGFKDRILSAALKWFSHPPKWSFGGNRLQLKSEAKILRDVEESLRSVSQIGLKPAASRKSLQAKQDLLFCLLQDEQLRLNVWLSPLNEQRNSLLGISSSGRGPSDAVLIPLLKPAWAESPALAIQLLPRFQSPKLKEDIRWLLLNFPEKAISESGGLEILLGSSLPDDISFQLKYLMYWAPVNPITAVTYFLPAYGNHPFIIQYAMRTLESHSVDITFFYVPQIVQALRYDALGYVERYIIETGKFSQLFAHQIIWNMKANAYKDEDAQVPDPVKPTLDKVMESLVSSFSGEDKAFYEREFSFFNEVTDISGKLRPYIKRSKPEKKQKIEEELRKIKVEVGVYLPSNPDGVVIGIDRKSGKPLQSHAKAPYMATFRIRKNKESLPDATDQGLQNSDSDSLGETTIDVWQSAIFKVGDDCRQDVLALQMIAAFRGIFNSVGLDVYVYPYRVTATAPGCGVIDVLPNSISRDMLGREAVNGLYEYFVSKYGSQDSVRFQEARNNFVKSMASYSLISFLLQFKDRHNGNIMVDDAGHILHIDFGFCFDIAPGGVGFERAPFKLTSEMVAVMGGSPTSQSFRWFEELCIKSFLASRKYVEQLVHIVILMLDSGLPCFKPATVKNFRERFVLEKTEREAAEFIRSLVHKSYQSNYTKGYDMFQLATNGIPY